MPQNELSFSRAIRPDGMSRDLGLVGELELNLEGTKDIGNMKL